MYRLIIRVCHFLDRVMEELRAVLKPQDVTYGSSLLIKVSFTGKYESGLPRKKKQESDRVVNEEITINRVNTFKRSSSLYYPLPLELQLPPVFRKPSRQLWFWVK